MVEIDRRAALTALTGAATRARSTARAADAHRTTGARFTARVLGSAAERSSAERARRTVISPDAAARLTSCRRARARACAACVSLDMATRAHRRDSTQRQPQRKQNPIAPPISNHRVIVANFS